MRPRRICWDNIKIEELGVQVWTGFSSVNVRDPMAGFSEHSSESSGFIKSAIS